MSDIVQADQLQRIISDIDHLINEILDLRRRVAALGGGENKTNQSIQSVRDSEGFGMWADREDMKGLSSRDWLTQVRTQQWGG